MEEEVRRLTEELQRRDAAARAAGRCRPSTRPSATIWCAHDLGERDVPAYIRHLWCVLPRAELGMRWARLSGEGVTYDMGVDEAGQEELAVLELDKVDGPKHAMAREGILDLVRVDVALEPGDVAGVAGDGEEGAREGVVRGERDGGDEGSVEDGRHVRVRVRMGLTSLNLVACAVHWTACVEWSGEERSSGLEQRGRLRLTPDGGEDDEAG